MLKYYFKIAYHLVSWTYFFNLLKAFLTYFSLRILIAITLHFKLLNCIYIVHIYIKITINFNSWLFCVMCNWSYFYVNLCNINNKLYYMDILASVNTDTNSWKSWRWFVGQLGIHIRQIRVKKLYRISVFRAVVKFQSSP